MRVGLVAKGLLLKGDLDLELVLLCKEKPTSCLLKKVSDNLILQLKVRTGIVPSHVISSIHHSSDALWVTLEIITE